MTTNNPRARIARAALAVASAVGLTLAVVPAAMAAPSDTSTIDPDATGSITIHRFASTAGIATDGTEIPDSELPTDREPLNGVKYTIAKVTDLDLTTQAGWQALEAMNGAVPTSGLDAWSQPEETVNGIAQFTQVKVGAYVVHEELTTAQTAEGHDTTPDFLVTVPFTDPETGTWDYNVHAYPKSIAMGVTKTINDAAAFGRGDDVTWSLSAAVPKDREGASAADLATLSFKDIYNGQLQPDKGTLVVQYQDGTEPPVTIPATTAAAEGGQPSTNYTADFTNAGTGTTWGDFSVTFDPSYLNTLQTHTRVILTLTAPVRNIYGTLVDTQNHSLLGTAPAIAPSDLFDQAQLHATWRQKEGTRAAASTANDKTAYANATTQWGQVTIKKTTTDKQPIEGATFSIFKTLADAQAAQTGNSDALAKAIGVLQDDSEGATQVKGFTTVTGGQVVIKGLRFTTSTNNTADQDHKYFAVETKAAPNFELSPEVKAFTIDSKDPSPVLTFTDVPTRGGFQLPLAGGPGLALLLIIGAAVVGGSAYAYRKTGTTKKAS